MTKFYIVLYVCSMLSGQCPSYKYTGHSFDNHAECIEFGYRIAYGTFKELEELEEFSKEYIENSRIAVKFECKPIKVKEPIIPPPKPKGKAT
jgi:hypothetical protein